MSLGLASEVSLAATRLDEAKSLFNRGQYFSSARYAFDAREASGKVDPMSYALIARALVRAGLHQSASYFYIRSLQTGEKGVIREALKVSEELFMRVGADVFKPYSLKYTQLSDYDQTNRDAYLYVVGKDALLKGKYSVAVDSFSQIREKSPLKPYAFQLRATARAIAGDEQAALQDFKACQDGATQVVPDFGDEDSRFKRDAARESEDLKNRCIAGEARTLYQLGKFEEADRTYDRVQKTSMVWPEVLFEQSWNYYRKREYNRTLGKLVSYKSPALSYVYNSEIDVVRALSYLTLCLYSDTNQAIREFYNDFTALGEEVKKFVEANSGDLKVFYSTGKKALRGPLHTEKSFHRLMNRFVRSPYFQGLARADDSISKERAAIAKFASFSGGPGKDGLPGFLGQVLEWRGKTIQQLGGAYVKNSLMDYHATLLNDFDKMSFIKLEMMRRNKESLLGLEASNSRNRSRGVIHPSRRGDQYYWSFNGEYWNDELGDYVFGLESACGT